MVKWVLGLLVAGAVAAAGALYLLPGWRERVVAQGTRWMDDVMGIKTREAARKHKAAEARPRPERPAPKRAPAAPSHVVAPAPSPGGKPAHYVNRDPYPTTVEKVPEKDRRRLDDLIAQRLGKGDKAAPKVRAD